MQYDADEQPDPDAWLELDEAERIDLQSPSIRRARGELARARGSQQTSSD